MDKIEGEENKLADASSYKEGDREGEIAHKVFVLQAWGYEFVPQNLCLKSLVQGNGLSIPVANGVERRNSEARWPASLA